MASKSVVLNMYVQLRREGRKIDNYNFREYAKRRVYDAFQANKNKTDPAEIKELIKKAEEGLALLRRQAVLGSMYKDKMSIIEQAHRV